ncbi:alpha/beta hydrolase [Arthrobacter ipis]|uniref:alpha/beta fold hydrolase n=1 Tax=Arthrobacter ipis TaxID=2716202 RepID=UPI00288B1C3B|nr:alpha/beta hydrolase [Arthrobacter ipis]
MKTSHGALNVVRTPGNGRTGQSIVLLSGLGTPASALDFAPLVRELGDYDVVVVEGFGYGYSDQSAVERTVENITSELHEALANADVPGPYVLAGHSIAGFYTLAYANRYRNDVAAVIGIDPTVPAARTIHAEETGVAGGGINWEGLIAASDLPRWAATIAPGLVEPDGTAYTSRERDQIRKMAIWNFGNPSVVDETNRMAENARKVQAMRYPDDLPVLTLLASAKETPADVALHESRLQNVRKHETVTLPGGHYLHWTMRRPWPARSTPSLPPTRAEDAASVLAPSRKCPKTCHPLQRQRLRAPAGSAGTRPGCRFPAACGETASPAALCRQPLMFTPLGSN